MLCGVYHVACPSLDICTINITATADIKAICKCTQSILQQTCSFEAQATSHNQRPLLRRRSVAFVLLHVRALLL